MTRKNESFYGADEGFNQHTVILLISNSIIISDIFSFKFQLDMSLSM